MTQIQTSKQEVLALTGLRAVAALLVFAFHIHIRWPLTENGWIDQLLSQGAVGMSVFFILSGYILAYTYAGRTFSLNSYFTARIARIYPVYIAAGILALPWLAIVFKDGFIGIARGVALILANTLMIQAWFPQLFGYWNNPAAWSLSVEAFFYLLFPFIVIGLQKLTKRGLVASLAMAYCLAVMPGFIYAVFEPRPTPALSIFYAMPIFRLPEFVFGITIYLLRNELRRFSFFGGFAALVLLAYLSTLGDILPLFVLHNWVAVPLIGVLIISLAEGVGAMSKLLSTRPAVYAGKISFCFYMFQFPVIFGTLQIRKYIELGSFEAFAVCFVALTILSIGGYHLIEEPFRKIIRERGFNQGFASA